MMTARRPALVLTLCCATLGSASAQNGSVSTEAPNAVKTHAPAAQKSKAAAHPKKQDVTDTGKKPAPTTIPMDSSYIKKPGETETPSSSSSKSDFDGPMKPDLNSNGKLSPGMKFSW